MKVLWFVFVSMLFCSVALAGSVTDSPKHMVLLFDPGESKTFMDVFAGGEVATITVEGHGRGGDIDCFLSTMDGTVVAAEVGPENSCIFVWRPREKQGYMLRLVNAGSKGTMVDVTNN